MGRKKRYFSGYVSSFVQRPRAEGFYRYEATIVPWLWFLTRTADCRIFHAAMAQPPEEMTVPGILKKVFKDHGFDDVTPALNGNLSQDWIIAFSTGKRTSTSSAA